MKRTYYFLIAVVSIILLFATAQSATSASQEKEVITLKLADIYAVTHPMYKVTKSFVKKLEDTGRIKVNYYPAAQLGTQADGLNIATKGLVDISYAAPVFLPSQLELTQIMCMPNIATSSREGTEIFGRLLPIMDSEYRKYKVRPLIWWMTPQYDIFTSKKPITEFKVIKGLKIRGGGGILDRTIAALGATPVTLTSQELFEAFQKGIVDGVAISFMSSRSYKLDEIAKYSTKGANLGSILVNYVISDRAWEKLPDDLKKAVEQAGKEINVEGAKVWDDVDDDVLKDYKSRGMQIYTLTESDKQTMEEAGKTVIQEWIADMEKKGIPARKAYAELIKVRKEIIKK